MEVGDTTQVGAYPTGASFYGALDMAGNVWEWVRDEYGENNYASSPARNPENTTVSGQRGLRGGSWLNVAALPSARIPPPLKRGLRGGSWNYVAASVRASNRDGDIPDYRYDFIGFRCVR